MSRRRYSSIIIHVYIYVQHSQSLQKWTRSLSAAEHALKVEHGDTGMEKVMPCASMHAKIPNLRCIVCQAAGGLEKEGCLVHDAGEPDRRQGERDILMCGARTHCRS